MWLSQEMIDSQVLMVADLTWVVAISIWAVALTWVTWDFKMEILCQFTSSVIYYAETIYSLLYKRKAEL